MDIVCIRQHLYLPKIWNPSASYKLVGSLICQNKVAEIKVKRHYG